jgi:hypothetical protein
VPEGILIARRSAPAFDTALPGMPAIVFRIVSDDFRSFYQSNFRLLTAKNIRTSFAHVQKNGENFSSYFGTLYWQ